MKKIHSAFAPFLGILILLAVWFLLCRAEVFSPYLLPTPQKVFDSKPGGVHRDAAHADLRGLQSAGRHAVRRA